jgi:hypothetical protein
MSAVKCSWRLRPVGGESGHFLTRTREGRGLKIEQIEKIRDG